MKDTKNLKKSIFVVALILVAALTRILPHPPNFTPIAGMAIFGALFLRTNIWPLALVFVSYFVSDLVLNNLVYSAYYPDNEGVIWFTDGALFIYGGIALMAVCAFFMLKNFSWSRLGLTAIVGSVLFFLVSNFGVWATGLMYPKTMEGLTACYVAGLPFLGTALLGNLLFSYLLFGLYAKVGLGKLSLERL